MLYGGFGRAILLIRQDGLDRHRDLVLHYCTHFNAYDRQCEHNRADYLYPLISESTERQWFRDRIMDALLPARISGDAEQLFDLAALFARNGDAGAREAIYEKFRRNDTDYPFTGDDALIRLDGANGLIAVLDLIGSHPSVEREVWEDDHLIQDAEKVDGIEEVRQALQGASSMPGVARVLERIGSAYSPYNTPLEIRAIRKQGLAKRRAYKDDVPEGALWWEIKNHPRFDSVCVRWARRAPDEEVVAAAGDIPSGDDPRRLRSYLNMFHWRPYPLDPAPLIALVEGSDDKTALRALGALEEIEHPAVREFAFRLMDNPKWADRAVGLLEFNYEQGDHEAILRLIERTRDPDSLHLLGIDVMDVYKENQCPEGVQPLLRVYQKGPCSMCRYGVVEMLHELGALPEWMAEECIHDAYSCTRELAAKLI